MKRICILCLLAALLLGACGLADAPYMEPVRTYCAALQDDDFTMNNSLKITKRAP